MIVYISETLTHAVILLRTSPLMMEQKRYIVCVIYPRALKHTVMLGLQPG